METLLLAGALGFGAILFSNGLLTFLLRILWGWDWARMIYPNPSYLRPSKVVVAIFGAPALEEILFRGPLLLLALWLGVLHPITLFYLAIQILVFAAFHMLVIEEQFLTSFLYEQEKQRLKILVVLATGGSAVIYSILTLYFLNLWPAILAHTFVNAFAILKRVQSRNRKPPSEEVAARMARIAY